MVFLNGKGNVRETYAERARDPKSFVLIKNESSSSIRVCLKGFMSFKEDRE